MKLTDLTKARVGDKLWDSWEDTWVEIEKINHNYPHVTFTNCQRCDLQGRDYVQIKISRYYWNPITFEIPAPPKRMVKKLVRVWHHKDAWKDNMFYQIIPDSQFNEQTNGYHLYSKNYVCHEYEVEVEE